MRISDWSSDVCSSDLDAGRPDDEVHAIDDEVAHRDAVTPVARADAIAPAGVRAVLAAQEQLVRPVAFLEADAVKRVARELRELQAKEHAEAVRPDGGAPRPVVDLARCLVEDAGVPELVRQHV